MKKSVGMILLLVSCSDLQAAFGTRLVKNLAHVLDVQRRFLSQGKQSDISLLVANLDRRKWPMFDQYRLESIVTSLQAGTSSSKIAMYQETTSAVVDEIRNEIVKIDLKKKLERYSYHCKNKSSCMRDYLSLNRKNEDKV